MNIRLTAFVTIVLVLGAACQQTLVAVAPLEPTTVPATAVALATPRATQTPRTVILPTGEPLPTQPLQASAALPSLVPPSVLVTPPLSSTIPAVTPAGTVVLTLPPADNTFSVGLSAQGREILGWRFGSGEKVILLVGGIHAGFESNTVMLVNELVKYFAATPAGILPGITLMLIPVANPDGLAQGWQSAGRFNANNVDLNRNWGCEWSAEAYWQTRQVNAGANPFSEPETLALSAFIHDRRPSAVIFYHSSADGVFAGDCEGRGVSGAFAAVLGEATGYSYGRPFTAYPVTGTAASWVDGLGIPAVDLELTTTRGTEFVRNLAGIMAAQCWLTGLSLPACA